jgi:hypothetical protein
MPKASKRLEVKDMLDIRQIDPINVSRLHPPLTCVGFQNLQPGKLKDDVTIDGVRFATAGNKVQSSIIEMPAPQDAYPWVPDPVRYFESQSFAGHWLTIEFEESVRWVELNAAPGKVDPFVSSHSIFVFCENSMGRGSATAEELDAPFVITTVTFTSASLVRVGGGEFGPPETLEPAGEIKRLRIYAGNSDIVVWQVCYGGS